MFRRMAAYKAGIEDTDGIPLIVVLTTHPLLLYCRLSQDISARYNRLANICNGAYVPHRQSLNLT